MVTFQVEQTTILINSYNFQRQDKSEIATFTVETKDNTYPNLNPLHIDNSDSGIIQRLTYV